jgi:methylated-DNA-[protein]-cysteine S-methyltransferase
VKNFSIQEAPTIQWGKMPSPLGELFIAVSRQGLCAVEFGRSEKYFLARFAAARAEKNATAIKPAIEQLKEYFAGRLSEFSIPVDLSALTPFQRKVLATTSRIPLGQVRSYQQVANEMGCSKSSRPVGQSLGRNPVPIVIPCHRVIASDGSLGGYSGGSGLKAKRFLLQLEGAVL